MINHFLTLSNLSIETILSLLKRAQDFEFSSPSQFNQILKNKIIANVFYEPSTRTRCSFEIAAKKLGAEVINFSPDHSSVKKGESLYDTLKTFESLGVDAIILRHSDDHIFDTLAHKIKIPLINAGAGRFEHPSQGLLDLYTIQKEFKTLENLNIGICGDIKHSRVAGSMIVAAEKFKMNLFFSGPSELQRTELKAFRYEKNFDDLITKVDALMMLRIQFERHENLELNEKDYLRLYGLNSERTSKMKNHSIIMHPGPFNRNIEIADEVIEHPKSRIFEQVKNGVYTRMSLLEYVLGDLLCQKP